MSQVRLHLLFILPVISMVDVKVDNRKKMNQVQISEVLAADEGK